MPEFSYRAASAEGQLQSGRLEASSREAALHQLQSRGLTPVQLNAGVGSHVAAASARKPERKAAASRRRARGTPNQSDVHVFTSEMAVMLRAGLSLDRALRILIEMIDKPTFGTVIEDIYQAVKGGKGLSQALAPHQALFGDFYINMVRSGEIGGQLAEVLSRLTEHLERVKVLRESVVSALIYPAILVVVAAISVFLMLGFVVPQFQSLFDDLGEALPLPTRIVVSAGNFVADWFWLIAIGVAALVWLTRRWLATPGGRGWLDSRLLSLPVFGDVLRKYELTRFARSMGTLLGNDVPIVTAIHIATATMSNHSLREAMAGVAPALKQGVRLADALAGAGLFSPLGLNMVRLGEETGRLDEMLLELARVHDAEVQAGIKRALTLVEPALILTLGVVIAGIIVSILMGIMSANELAF